MRPYFKQANKTTKQGQRTWRDGSVVLSTHMAAQFQGLRRPLLASTGTVCMWYLDKLADKTPIYTTGENPEKSKQTSKKEPVRWLRRERGCNLRLVPRNHLKFGED